MSGAKLVIEWKEATDTDLFSPSVRTEAEAAHGERLAYYSRQICTTETLKCPHCGSIIYSRKNRLCGVCDAALPEELLFSAAEMKRVEQLLEEERLRHRLWMAKMLGPR